MLARPVPARLLTLVATVALVTVAGCGGDDGAKGGKVTVTTGAAGGPAQVTVDAHDVYFDPAEIRAPAGDVEVTLVEQGTQSHTFVVDGVDGFKLGVSGTGSEDAGTLTLDAGEYDYYCDIPGHRGQGMEGTLVLE